MVTCEVACGRSDGNAFSSGPPSLTSWDSDAIVPAMGDTVLPCSDDTVGALSHGSEAVGWANKCLQNAVARLLSGSERKAALAYFRRACANHAACGHGADSEERTDFIRVLWFLVSIDAFVWVYEPSVIADSAAWRLGCYHGRCIGALCWGTVNAHVRPGCLQAHFVELPLESAPWLRSVVGAPKAGSNAKGRAKAKSARGAHLRGAARDERGRVVAAASAAATPGAGASPVASPCKSVSLSLSSDVAGVSASVC